MTLAGTCSSIVLLVFAAIAPQGAPAEDPGLFVPCITCSGQGRVEGDCWGCAGGRHACQNCGRFRVVYRRRWSNGWIPEAMVRFLDVELPELPDLPPLGGSKKKAPKAAEIGPGEFRCPARCRGGKLLHVDDWVDCKLCKKGKFDCDHCKDGTVECVLCDGRGLRLRPCDDCAGVGRVPDATSLAFTTCPWCLDEGQRACGTCDEAGRALSVCRGCLGALVLPCSECKGIEKIKCRQCGGRGRFGPHKRSCEPCKKKGVLPCRLCDDGLAPCESCDGRPAQPGACRECDGAREHPCNGCGYGAYESWLHASRQARQRGDHERARGWLDMAEARCRARYTGVLGRLKGDDEALLEVIEEELRDELERIEELRTSLGEDP